MHVLCWHVNTSIADTSRHIDENDHLNELDKVCDMGGVPTQVDKWSYGSHGKQRDHKSLIHPFNNSRKLLPKSHAK